MGTNGHWGESTPDFRWKRVWSKIHQIINNRFGCTLIGAWDGFHYTDQNAWFHTLGADETSAKIQVIESRCLTPRERQELSEILDSVLAPFLSGISQSEDLEILHERLLVQSRLENVIPIRSKARLRNMDSISTSFQSPKRHSFQIPILIEAQSYSDISKMALEIHDNSERFAFVHFDELSDATRENSEEIANLRGMTVFISEICELDPKEQKALQAYLDMPFSSRLEAPQIICGTVFSYSDLRQKTLIDGRLLRRVATAFLKMDRSFKEYKEMGVMKFFLQSLTLTPVR